MRRNILSAMIVTVLTSVIAYAAEPNQTTEKKARADALLAQNAKPGHPGCAVGVYENGSALYENAFGLANLEHSVPIDPQRTVFEIGSVSKQFTAAAILLLVQDGKLGLEDDIRKYLPEIPDYGHAITIGQLLHHTSGLRDYTDLRWFVGKNQLDYTSETDGLNLISMQNALDFSPGEKYRYSNTGYFLASVIVKRVSGVSLAEFAKQRIFLPLGMSHTYFEESPRVVPHHASGYELDKTSAAFEALRTGWSEYGDAGVQTTVADLAKWQRNFDDPKVGGAWLVEQLQKKGTLNNGDEIDYAAGLEVYDSGYKRLFTVLHNGGTADGYRASLLRFPDERLSIAVLCNSPYDGILKLRDQLADVFMEGRFPAPMQPVTTAESPAQNKPARTSEDVPSTWLGTYWNREDMTIRRIEREGGKTWYVRSPESRTELAAIEGGQLQMLGIPSRVVLTTAPSGSGPQIVHVKGQTTSVLEKVAPPTTDLKSLNEYAGTYTSADIDGARWSFVVKDGKLVLVPPPEGLEEFTPVFKDAFLDNDEEVLLVFKRDATGKVESLWVDTSRIRNITFTKTKSQ